jgi:hypothetical protein
MPRVGTLAAARVLQQLTFQLVRDGAVFQGGHEVRERPPVASRNGLQVGHAALRQVEVALRDHVVDHALQAHRAAVLDGIDVRHAVVVQFADLRRHDDAAAAAEDLDALAAATLQQVHHVLEVLDVAALVGGDGDALHVLLQRRGDDLLDRAVVAEVDHLRAGRLQDAPHDVDRGVVAVEQRRRGDEAHLVLRLVGGDLPAHAQVGHGGRSNGDGAI